MKLIGSKMESDYRKGLITSHDSHFKRESKLKRILEEYGHSTERAYVLSWFPDQDTEYFCVLVDGEYLVHIEIDRYESSAIPKIERSELNNYLKGLSRMHQVQLAVARDLASGNS